MAEEMKQELSAEEAEQLALVENDRDAPWSTTSPVTAVASARWPLM